MYDKRTGLPTNTVAQVALDDRCVWCALGDGPLGVGRLDRRSDTRHLNTYRAGIPCNHIYSLQPHGTALYVGTMANGFWQYDISAGRWDNLNLHHRSEHNPVRRADVYCLLLFRNALWLGTNTGLFRYELGSDRHDTRPLVNPPVSALALNDSTILCGTKDGRLLAIEDRAHRVIDLGRRSGLKCGPITALATDATGIWIGTDDGLAFLAPGRRPRGVPPRLRHRHVTALLTGQAVLWIGTARGLLRWDLLSGEIRSTALGSAYACCIRPSQAQPLVGTRSGLALLANDGASVVFEPRLRGQLVSDMVHHGQGLWIATLGGGLIRAAGLAKPATSPPGRDH